MLAIIEEHKPLRERHGPKLQPNRKFTQAQKDAIVDMLKRAHQIGSMFPAPIISIDINGNDSDEESEIEATVVYDGVLKLGKDYTRFKNVLKDAIDMCKKITLHLDTTGGSYVVAKSIMKMIQAHKKRGGWIECIIKRECSSAGPMIAKECNVVKMHRDAKWMIHFSHGISYEKLDELRTKNVNPKYILHQEDNMQMWINIWSQQLNQPPELIKDLCNFSRMLSAEDGLKYNFINEIFN